MSTERRFVVRFPCITLGEHLGGQRALVFMSARPKGADENLVLATCMDINGRMHGNVPTSMAAIKYASENGAITLVEMPSGVAAPMAGLVGLDGKKLIG
jgi:hypothetical protein